MIPPGSVPPRIRMFEYSAGVCREQEVPGSEIESLRSIHSATDRQYWVDVQGLGDEHVLRLLADIFDLHALTLEDVTNVPSRPKTEQHDGYQVFVTRMLRFCAETGELVIEQVSVIWNHRLVLTMQEKSGDILDPIRSRLRDGVSRPIRLNGPDYLAYAIVDCIVDGFYPVLESYAEWIEELESEAVSRPQPQTLEAINELRRELASLRRAILPQREAVMQLISGDSPFVSDVVRVFLRDTGDHCRQVADVVESYREFASGLLNTYLSCVGHRTNEIMKVLTIMASIFIPLTFMAGIYGMNFEWMPELKLWWAYPMLLILMLLTAAGMLGWFRRLGWIGRPALRVEDRTDPEPKRTRL